MSSSVSMNSSARAGYSGRGPQGTKVRSECCSLGPPQALGLPLALCPQPKKRGKDRCVRAVAVEPVSSDSSKKFKPRHADSPLGGVSRSLRIESPAGQVSTSHGSSTKELESPNFYSDAQSLHLELRKTQLKLSETQAELEAALARLQQLERNSQEVSACKGDAGEADERAGQGVSPLEISAYNTDDVARVEDKDKAVSASLAASGALAEVVVDLPPGQQARKARQPEVGRQHPGASVPGSKALKTTGRISRYSDSLKSFWFPVAFSSHVDGTTMVPIECFEEPWVIFRDGQGRPGCIRDECAHRACPLSLGTVSNGRVVCPYHGWEYSTEGLCEKMPSTKLTHVSVASLPCIERDGLIWIWPAPQPPPEDPALAPIPDTKAPSNYVVHAELVMELPVEHGLLVENLLDLAHAPFTHTSTFARGWSVPNFVRFKTAASVLNGNWDPYPIAMEFRPPCVVVSTIGLAKPGQLEGGQSAAECSQHLFQMHACVPSSPGKTRLLYRMGLDFASWVKHVPFINRLWMYLAAQVLDEDLRLVVGQQDRMHRGGNVWNHPVLYDKLAVGYRRWRNAVEGGGASDGFAQ